jgi:hypothetical protein
LVKLGYTATYRTGTRRRAAPVRPRAPRTVPPPWRPGRAPSLGTTRPKAALEVPARRPHAAWRALTRRSRTTPWTTGRFRPPPCRALLPRPAHTPRDVAIGPSVAGRHACRHKGVTAPYASRAKPRPCSCAPLVPAIGAHRGEAKSQGDRDQVARARPDSLRPLPRLLARRSKPLSRPSTARCGHCRAAAGASPHRPSPCPNFDPKPARGEPPTIFHTSHTLPGKPLAGILAGAAGSHARGPQFFLGALAQNCISNSICKLLNLVNFVENRRKSIKMQTQFCWIRSEEYCNFCYTHLV